MFFTGGFEAFEIDSWLEDGAVLRVKDCIATVLKFAASVTIASAVTLSPAHSSIMGAASEMNLRGPPGQTTAGREEINFTQWSQQASSGVSYHAAYDQRASDVWDPDAGMHYEPRLLNASLQKLLAAGPHVASTSLNPRTVRVARIIAHQIPARVPPSIGIDDEGNIFLHFKAAHATAYLTVEARALHLFCKLAGKPNIYIDNEPYSGKRLPANIRQTLFDLFAT